MKWIVEDGMVFPTCPHCGAYPLLKRGRDEYSNYLLQCGACGKTVATKTPLKNFVEKQKGGIGTGE